MDTTMSQVKIFVSKRDQDVSMKGANVFLAFNLLAIILKINTVSFQDVKSTTIKAV